MAGDDIDATSMDEEQYQHLVRVLQRHFGLRRLADMTPEQYGMLNPGLKQFTKDYLNPIRDPMVDETLRLWGPLRPIGSRLE